MLTKDAVENLMGQQLKALLQQRAFSQSSFKKQGARAAVSKQPKVTMCSIQACSGWGALCVRNHAQRCKSECRGAWPGCSFCNPPGN